MTRSLVSIGVALIDAGVRPDLAKWLIGLFDSAGRAYLPRPRVIVERRQAVLRFDLDDRELIILAFRPGVACWQRSIGGDVLDQGPFGAKALDRSRELFDWLLDDAFSRVPP